MRDLRRFLDVVELATLDWLPVLPRCWNSPVGLGGTRWAKDFHPCRAVRRVATQFLVDVEVPRRVGVEAGEYRLLVAAYFSGFLEYDLGVAFLAEHPSKGM
jgi:hypothetical protein